MGPAATLATQMHRYLPANWQALPSSGAHRKRTICTAVHKRFFFPFSFFRQMHIWRAGFVWLSALMSQRFWSHGFIDMLMGVAGGVFCFGVRRNINYKNALRPPVTRLMPLLAFYIICWRSWVFLYRPKESRATRKPKPPPNPGSFSFSNASFRIMFLWGRCFLFLIPLPCSLADVCLILALHASNLLL